jgi:DNA repair photolyase
LAESVFTNPISVTSQFSFCGLPLRLDTYAGCAFRCSYCFARYRGGSRYDERVRPADPETIKRVFRFAIDLRRFPAGIVAQFLRRRVPIHVGGMSDPFQPAETRYRVTESVLRTLLSYRYPTVISTRSAMPSLDPYMSLLREMSAVVQFSFSTTRDEASARVEPHATRPSILLKTMETLAHRGVNVTCRWQPFIPNFGEPEFEFVRRVSDAGCLHIGLEHLKVPVENQHPLWAVLTKGLGRDIGNEYRLAGAWRDGREFILPPSEKLSNILSVAEASKRHKISFGAADNEFQYLSNTDCCCSGVDQFPGFENWFKHQIAYAVRKSRGKRITYDLIAHEWIPKGSIDRYLNSRSRLGGRIGREATMKDHIRTKWNNPNLPGSPTSFFGVQSTGTTTRSGNAVYRWDPELSPWAKIWARTS